jgi:hypothetical protein
MPRTDVASESRMVLVKHVDELGESAWKQEVAHAFDRAHDAKVEDRLALAAIVLSTVVGGSVFASLSGSPQTWAKVLVGVLSVAAAVAAAVNARGPFSGRSTAHAVARSGFASIHDRAARLHRELELELGGLTLDEANERLNRLHDDYDKQKDLAPPTSHYSEAERWVDEQLKKDAPAQLRVPV